ncbi:MAG TPA: glycosyltransferase [Ktedonobacterales bacterium]
MSFQPRPNVLILYADTGSGHRSVAYAIDSALHRLTPDVSTWESAWETTLQNPLLQHPLGRLLDLYGPMTRRTPPLFAEIYRLTDSARVCDLSGRLAYQFLRDRLNRLIEATQPAVVVCVHSLLARPMLQALRRNAYDIPLFSVVTDLASIHQSWILPDVDQCFVPTVAVRDEMVRRGMRADQLRVSGLPIHPSYGAQPGAAVREALRLSMGLHPNRFTVLVMGGGEGVGRLDMIAQHLAESHLPVQMVIVAGNNHSLVKRLNALQHRWSMPHKIFGFAHNIPDLMRAADVVITKAGSVTIAESLASGLPIILSSVIEGQESGNVNYLARNGVGELTRRPEEVAAAVRRLLSMDEELLRDLRARARRLSMPAAAFHVAGHILDAVDRGCWRDPDAQVSAQGLISPVPMLTSPGAVS